MRKFRIKRKTRKFLLGILGIGLIIGAVALIGNLVNKSNDEELKEIHPTFEVGGLTEDGKYLENKESIYTKKSFECQGLNVKLDFDADVTYQIFFYDELDEFVSKTNVLSVGYNDAIPSGAKLARIVVTPTYSSDVEDEDKEIKWYEIRNYSKQLTISVNKEQLKSFTFYCADEPGCKYPSEVTLYFEDGMTWADFIESDYNTVGLIIDGDNLKCSCSCGTCSDFTLGFDTLDASDFTSVKLNDLIIEDCCYYLG
jgi:hypothetical protein